MEKLRDDYLVILRDSNLDAFYNITISDTDEKVYPENIALGTYWPGKAASMIGKARMDNIRFLLERAIKDDIEGDFLEAGVWRGGACI